MNCIFDLCEFYNIIIGGIGIGLITSALFIIITNFTERKKFYRKYKYLKSTESEYDWVCYSMREDNGRIRQDSPNGSRVHINLEKRRIYLKLMQSDKRIWKGELVMHSESTGTLSFKYEHGHEYGKRDCFIGHFKENEIEYDYLFLIPLNNNLYYLQTDNEGKIYPYYHYGNEIIIRERKIT